MRSLSLLTCTSALLVATTLAGCSSDDGEGPDDASSSATANGDSGSEAEAGPDCEIEVPGGGEVVLPVGVEAAEESLTAAQVEATSVDVRTGSSLAGCVISWDDEDGRGGSVSVSAVKAGQLMTPEAEAEAYPVGEWVCLSQAFDKKNVGGICATEGVDVAVILNPGDAEAMEAFLEVFIPTLTV